uniref:YbaB/EbfC family nucleoid-associated protein n=1 Tax=Pararhizobium sp. IMCC3301 TaxID=3067904 RepID=UPI002740C429|nr:YbaB/EbfC family nucleoid-associated protein [Pararhizobium sp. IMCC3301]
MKNIMGMMKQAQELQQKMQDAQAEIAELEIEGTAGAGLVRVKLSGQGQIKAISIDPSLIDPQEPEMLEDLIMAAHNDAKSRSESVIAEKMKDVTGGLNLPEGMKLPF